jgi:opacity protein-like surface antigen
MRRLAIIILLAMATASIAGDHAYPILEIGARTAHFDLRDSTRTAPNYFLGGLDEFIEEQGYVPLPFVNIRFNPYLAVGVGYGTLRAKTWSRPDIEGEIGHSDGTIDASGPTVSGQLRFPNRSRYTPFLEVGLLIYQSYFDHSDAWRNARGDRNSHLIDIDDQYGYRLGVGCDIDLNEDWSLLVMIERASLEIDATYYLYGDVWDEVTLPLDHMNYGIGVKYRL